MYVHTQLSTVDTTPLLGSEVEVSEIDEGKIHCRQWISTYATLL